MKKVILTLVCIVGALQINAQTISENAIGVRLGSNNGFGGEISYQRALSQNNRLEVDLGIRGDNDYSAFKATGLYQWVFPLAELDKNFAWYVGAGGGVGNWSIKDKTFGATTVKGSNSTFLFGTGVIGIEYNFDVPIQVSLDFRPEFGLSDVYKGFNSDFGLGVRYTF